jgi:hypothetical protein
VKQAEVVALSEGARPHCKLLMSLAQAAEHVQMLTRALAHQPYKFKVTHGFRCVTAEHVSAIPNGANPGDALVLLLHIILEAKSSLMLPQEMFLEVHGTGGDSTAAQELLVREPLAPEQLPLYRILNHTPSMGPAAAHVLAQQYSNLGNLMAAEFLNPSKCASWCQWDLPAERPPHLLCTLAAAGRETFMP